MAADYRAKATAAREAKAKAGGAHRAVPHRRPERDRLRPLRRLRRDAVRGAAGRPALAVGGRAVTRSADPPLRPRAPGRPAAGPARSPAPASPSTTGSIPALGRPLWWHLYNPFSVLWWASSWGLTPGYRAGFLSGLSLDVVVWLLPAAALRLREMREPLALEERPAGSRLGTAADLKALGAFGHRGPGHRRRARRQAAPLLDRRRARARARPDPDRQGRQQHRARRS